MKNESTSSILHLTAAIVSAYLSDNPLLTPGEIPATLREVYTTLVELESALPSLNIVHPDQDAITRSITPEHLISFINRKPYKTLKRHLRLHGMDMPAYRQKYGLPDDYPSVAPGFSVVRSEAAKKARLGHIRAGSTRSAPSRTTTAP